MLIDSHMHLFPEKLAKGTLEKLSVICGTAPVTDGTICGTISEMDRMGIDRGFVFHIATSPRSQQNVNRFALQVQEETQNRLLSFGSVHPQSPNAMKELGCIVEMNLHGIKLHPDYQGFQLEDRTYYPLFEEIAALGLPLALHTGYDPFSPHEIHAPTSAVVKLAKEFPQLTIIAAHMGGLGHQAEENTEIFAMKNIFFDTAVAPACYRGREQRFGEHLHRHGVDHVLFGTDCPWETVENTMELLERVLTPTEIDLVCFKNAQTLFCL